MIFNGGIARGKEGPSLGHDRTLCCEVDILVLGMEHMETGAGNRLRAIVMSMGLDHEV
jgi:hypothetical protein